MGSSSFFKDLGEENEPWPTSGDDRTMPDGPPIGESMLSVSEVAILFASVEFFVSACLLQG